MGILDAPGLTSAAAVRKFTGKTTVTPGRSGEVVAPKFSKVGGDLIIRSETGMPSILSMSVMCTDGVVSDPLGRYYAYISTDHDSAGTPEPFNGKGGVCLAYADNPLGPWTVHKVDGVTQIFQDLVEGNQTENPAPLAYPADPAGKGVYLYYGQQGAGMNQSTGLARSATGLPESFERVGLVIVGRPTWPGDGQRTYLQPMLKDGMVFGRHLIGGGDWAQIGFSYSYDGVNFVTDPRRLGHFSHLVGADNGRRLNVGSVFWWRGEPWAIATMGNHTSGFLTSPRQGCVVRLSRDLRRVVGQPVFFPDGVTGGFPIEADGRIYLFYRNGDAYSGFRAMVSEG